MSDIRRYQTDAMSESVRQTVMVKYSELTAISTSELWYAIGNESGAFIISGTKTTVTIILFGA